MRTVSAVGCTLLNAVAAGRRALGVSRKDSLVVLESGGNEDGLYRVTLATGDVIEATVLYHAVSEAHVVA